jgi:general secretion pathway protein A
MYNEFYGFSEKPFELTPDPRFLYLTRSHREALASMIHGIKNRKGFISMTGGVGTGKTTLIHSLLNNLTENVKTVLIFHTTITFTDLLKTILRQLDLATVKENRMDLLNQLVRYLVPLENRSEILLIIIDEAQNLPQKVMEELQMFSDLESKAIRIVFVGQPEFEDKLNSEGLTRLKKSIEIRRQLRGLNEEESKEYIDHRLGIVGSSSSEIFFPKALTLICSYAQGIPRLINSLCDNALLMGHGLSQKKIDLDIIRGVIKNMEGPNLQKTIPSSTTVVNKFRAFLFRLPFLTKKAYLILIPSLLCLGAFIFLAHRYVDQRSAKTWDIKSLKSPDVSPEPSSSPPSSQATPLPASASTMGREYTLKRIVAVRKGQTLSRLTQEYYGMVNLTLIDLLLELNPTIANVHLIIADQEIKIPHITEGLLIIQSPGHTYKIHAGTFEAPDPAKLYGDEPALKGRKIEILPRKVSPRETWYRVMIGQFDSEDEALKMISLLNEKRLLPAFGGLPKTR